MKQAVWVLGLAATVTFFVMSGCASKGYVDERIASLSVHNQKLNTGISSVWSELQEDIEKIQENVNNNQENISKLESSVNLVQEGNLDLLKELSETQKALERAKTSGKVKTGKLLYEVTISDESVPFSYAKSTLSDNAMSSLDVFAGSLIADNKEVYIEIQGHTDDVGSKKYNEELGQARAEAVKRYLHATHSIPLTRMGTISYGETMPVEKNDSDDNRAKNRRVILLVME